MSIICRGLLAGLLLVSINSSASAQPYSTVSLIVRFAGYVGLEYSDPPSPNSGHVFFSSEPIQLEIVMVNNRGTEPVRLLVGGKTLAASFSAKRRDGTDFELQLSNKVVRRYASSETPVDVGSEFTLSPKESLVLRADVPAGQLAPGEHVVLFAMSIKDSAGRPLAPQVSRQIFEVRPSNDASAIEEARRNATRAFVAREFSAAETWIETLLRAHPRSYAAYAMRGQIAELAGDRARARAAYQQAVDLLQSHADEHFLRRRRAGAEHITEELIGVFNQRIQANQDASAK